MGGGQKKNPKGAWALKDLGPKIKLHQALVLEEIASLEALFNLQTKFIKIKTYPLGVRPHRSK